MGNSFTTTRAAAPVDPLTTDPAKTTAYATTLDGHGNPQPAVTVTFQMLAKGARGLAWDRTPFTATSDAGGLLRVALAQGTRYRARRDDGEWVRFTTGTEPTYELPEITSQD